MNIQNIAINTLSIKQCPSLLNTPSSKSISRTILKKRNPFDEVVTMLIKDESHITLKIHQILYYLDDPYYREGRYY